MQKSIEDFLGLSKEDIRQREVELRAKIPTVPGTEYLEKRLQEFKVQPWPFVIYLAYNNPELLERGLSSYLGYDGATHYQIILEKIREYYIMSKLLYKMGSGGRIIDVEADVVSMKGSPKQEQGR